MPGLNDGGRQVSRWRRLYWSVRKGDLGSPTEQLLDHLTEPLNDVWERLRGRDVFVPPRRLRLLVGPERDIAAYVDNGTDFVRRLRERGGLGPDDHVLDVGCGCGHVAVPLTRILSARGGYAGFDVIRPLVEWCDRVITPRFPNFRFEHCDVANSAYNLNGRLRPREYVFPYEAGRFDIVFLGSVFTHMLPADVTHYVGEIARVLKPGGRILATYFLLKPGLSTTRGAMHFSIEGDGYRTISAARPEAAIALPESFVVSLHERYNLTIEQPIEYGFQDLIVARKASTGN
jgi:SAM-dependent methyltransferase